MLLLALFWSSWLVPRVEGAEITNVFLKGPYLQAPGDQTMTIMWESSTNRAGLIRYGVGSNLDRSLRLETPVQLPAVTEHSLTNVELIVKNNITNLTVGVKTNVTKISETNSVYLFELTLTNLRPNTVYGYIAETADTRTPLKHFKTFGSHPNRVDLIVYGDTRTNPKTHTDLASHFKKYRPDVILHLGDLVAEGKRYDLWGKEFFGPLHDVIDEVPILPVIGNHEQDGTNYLRYLHLPGKERWYSYDIGPVHVLSLDYHYEKATDEQFVFAQHDLLTSRAPWKVVTLHYPVFNIGGHNTGWGHAHYLPLFHEAKVDLVVGGHSHIYERFRPIASAKGSAAWPITYITTGGGGAPLAGIYSHPALAAREATNHFLVVEATAATLRGYALNNHGTLIDSFELKKFGGRPPSSYYSQVYPEESLKVSFEMAGNLTATADSVPSTNKVAQVTFSPKALKGWDQPLQIEISLTPTAAQYYRLPDGPLRVWTPSSPETNLTASLRICATGKKKITAEGKEKELSPALTFQARFMAGMVESMAYGGNCKVKTPPKQEKKQAAKTGS